MVYNNIKDIPYVKAKAFLLKETNSKDILYSKELNTKMSPASLTKVMTAVLEIESNRLNEIVTMPYEATKVEQFRFGASKRGR